MVTAESTVRLVGVEAELKYLANEADSLTMLRSIREVVVTLFTDEVPKNQWEYILNNHFEVRMGLIETKIKRLVSKLRRIGQSDLDFIQSMDAYIQTMKRAIPYVIDQVVGAKILTVIQINRILNEAIDGVGKERKNRADIDNAYGHLVTMLQRVKIRVA